MNTQGQIVLHSQECCGSFKFNGRLYMTAGFQAAFADMAAVIAVTTVMRIIQERVRSYGADYLQAASFQGLTFWIIDDVTHVTFLLPEEY
jgi:hypothetical protein